nr:spore germination protein [Ectobacillus ponti]
MNWFEGCNDVELQAKQMGSHYVLLVYCRSLIDMQELRRTILPQLYKTLEHSFSGEAKELEEGALFQMKVLKPENLKQDAIQRVFEGWLLVLLPAYSLACVIPVPKLPSRSVEDPSTEVSLRGGRDGFVEEMQTNIGLIRKRLKTSSLSCEEFIIGERSKTKVSLLYMKDVIAEDIVEQVRSRLCEIRVDAIVSATQVEELITDRHFTIFPLVEYTGRPDYAVNCLLYGRFLILVEGTPTATIGPVSLPFFVNNAEDQHAMFFFGSFGRVLRIISLLIAVFLPGFWIALVSYHPDQLPYTLLATLTLSREGIPVPAPLEGFVMIFLFELLREAGLRIPSTFGQTLSVVGGLIIGQAAISAGFVAPGIVVMMAVSVVATFTLVNQSLTGTLSILRYFVYILSSLLGVVGTIFSAFIIFAHLVNLRSFGLPYMTPYSPLVPTSLLPATLRVRFKDMWKRPRELRTNDSTRKKGGS